MSSISVLFKKRHGAPPKDHGIFFAQDLWHSYFQGDCPRCGVYQELQGPAHKDMVCPRCAFLLIEAEDL